MNKEKIRTRTNQVKEINTTYREGGSEIEFELADKYDPRIAKISIPIAGIFIGRIFSEWFITNKAVLSLSALFSMLAHFIVAVGLGLVVFWLSIELIKKWWPNNKQLDAVAFFGSIIGVFLGFLLKFVL